MSLGADSDFSITHDGTTGATITGNPVNITSSSAGTIKTTSGALTLGGSSGVDIKYGSNSQANFGNSSLTLKQHSLYNITHASNGNGQNLTIAQTGNVAAGLLLTSTGTHNTAIGLTASAGGIENQFAADKTYILRTLIMIYLLF